MKDSIQLHLIIRFVIHKLVDISKLLLFWKPHFLWLYKNRYLRMDANEPINDKRRRLFHIDRYEFTANYLKDKIKEGSIILDAACGTGYGSDILKKVNAGQIIGVDICPDTVKYANSKYGDKRCVFKVSNVMEMNEFQDEMFDAVVSFETIEHIDQPLVFLKNINRILKKKGILIISTPNKWGLTKDHMFDYDYALLKAHLESFFNIEESYTQNSGMELRINRGAPRRLVKATTENIEQAECFIAVCKKQ